MTLNLSRSFRIALLLAVALAATATLKPDPAAVSLPRDERILPKEVDYDHLPLGTNPPWLRLFKPGLAVPKPGVAASKAKPAPKPLAPPPPAPPPMMPEPGFVYRGRLVEDGRVRIFIEQGGMTKVVGLGDIIDGSWKVEGLSDTSLDLRYLPLDATRQVALP